MIQGGVNSESCTIMLMSHRGNLSGSPCPEADENLPQPFVASYTTQLSKETEN